MEPVRRQVGEIQHDSRPNHQEVVIQLSSPAVFEHRDRTEPVTREAATNELYCDMRRVQPPTKIPRHPRPPAAGKAGINSTELTSSKAQTPNGISSPSRGFSASIRKLSARLGRGKPRKPREPTHVYENVGTSSIYCNV